ncbi:MAG: transcription termination factor Rho [Actinomycetota bacterium]|nr:transcription termination factor Rho [Actinomycetota bacterium]
MGTESQLERSVLEKKDRGELSEIAGALQIKTTSRTKKSDMIDLILVGAGVVIPTEASSPPAVAKTRSVRSPKAAPIKTEGSAVTNGTELDVRAVAEAVEAPTSVETSVPPPIVVTSSTMSRRRPLSSTMRNGSNGQATTSTDELIDQEFAVKTAEELEKTPSEESPEARRIPEMGEGASRRSRRRRGRDRGDREREVSTEPPAPVELTDVEGILDLREEGFGFLRSSTYLPSLKDVYVAISVVRKYGLRKGDQVRGGARAANANEKYPALIRVDQVNGADPEAAKSRPKFEELTPLFPDIKLVLETPKDPANVTARIVDLVSPIGKGQRGLIVSPPKAGKTTIMKHIAHCIETNNPEVFLMVLLVDERPEEVTDMRRSVKGEVVASTFDRPAEEHTAVSELALERAKRLVELGQDVVIILDGITRLARAYNLAQPASGRIMSGGVDSGALYPPKKFFGAARNVEEGGSLTILATALVETGSRMDEVIFEEFKGTGNMELRLDRRLAERRLYPAIDVNASSTRHEELLFDKDQLSLVWKLRRVLNALSNDGNSAPSLELLIDKVRSTKSNAEFLQEIAKSQVPNNY